MNLTATVEQDGTEIPVGGIISSETPITVNVSFDIPVKDDDPTPAPPSDDDDPTPAPPSDEDDPTPVFLIHKGDTLKIELSDSIKPVSRDTFDLMMGSLIAGYVSFTTDPETNMVSAVLVFDGDDSLFDGTSDILSCVFAAEFEYDGGEDKSEAGDYTVSILGDTYTVNVPDDLSKLAKRGTLSGIERNIEILNIDKDDYMIEQDGRVIEASETINIDKPISIFLSFDVPVKNDGGLVYINHGDFVKIPMPEKFVFTSDLSIDLKYTDGTPVGTVNFVTESDGIYAKVVFDGDEKVFTDFEKVNCDFTVELEYDKDSNPIGSGTHIIEILGKTYNLYVPDKTITYKVEKTGKLVDDGKNIEWTVKVEVKQKDGTQIDLNGYKFFDDLSNVGDYVTGSFKVGSSTVAAVYDDTNSTLSYTFLAGTKSPQTIKFKTLRPTIENPTGIVNEISNTAELKQDSITLASGTGTVNVTPTWIVKKGDSSDAGSTVIYDPVNRTITWTIIANAYEASLKSVVITDVLTDGLTFNSATLAEWNDDKWGTAVTISPNAIGEYDIGDIDTKILLTIVTNVPKDDYTPGIKTFKNSASIKWQSFSGTGTGDISVGIGYNSITKSGSKNSADTQIINWTINVDAKGQTFPELKIYDLLVYGSAIDLTSVSGIPAAITKTDLTPQYNQQYITGTFNSTTGATLENVIEIKSGDKVVAELIVINPPATKEKYVVTFDSRIVNPSVFAENSKDTIIENTATLFSSNKKLNEATATVPYQTKTLNKNMLKRESDPTTVAGANKSTTNIDEGFNYNDKSVIFRINVNASSLNLTGSVGADGTPLFGNVTVTDNLPDGWEFTKILADEMFLLYEGTGNANGTVTAVTKLSTTSISSDFETSGTATFKFSNLTKPYVILVKAKLTDDAIESFFSKNQDKTYTNKVTLTTDKNNINVNDTQNVKVVSKILNKSHGIVVDGVLEWKVIYNPYNVIQDELVTSIEDTLPLGLDLRLDSKGKLILAGNIKVNKLTIKPDGDYNVGDEVDLILDDNISYDNASRILQFIIPSTPEAQAYQLTYKTDVTLEKGDVTNEVKLMGGSDEIEDNPIQFKIIKEYGSATMQRSAWIEITKTNISGTKLPGAKFAIIAKLSDDSEVIIREGVTNSDGVLKLMPIPNGTFILREISPPTGMEYDAIDHVLVVSGSGNNRVVEIDGRTGTDSNKITIKNYVPGTVGSLEISKTTTGTGADLTKTFEFKVTFNPAGSFNYVGVGIPGGTINSGDTISLADDQSVLITGIPLGTKYTVVETDPQIYGYTIKGESVDGVQDGKIDGTVTGTITVNKKDEVSFTNERTVGKLTIKKSVAGNGGSQTKKFTFKLELTGAENIAYPYTGTGISDGTIGNDGTVKLADGESITIYNLPAGATYTVTEEDYKSSGYITTHTGNTGTIEAEETKETSFKNTRDIGSLTISKMVEGNAGETDRNFKFTLTLTGADGVPYENGYEYPCTASNINGNSNVTKIKSGDYVELKHNEKITIENLPAGVKYEVTEESYSDIDYLTTPEGDGGTITTDHLENPQVALFTNLKTVGDLSITKTVAGNGGDSTKKFVFTVTFDGKAASYILDYFIDGSKAGTMSSGDEITLTHGQTATIKGIPNGTNYTVTEADYNSSGYITTTNTGEMGTIETGTIVTDETQEASFTNTRDIGSLTISKTVTGNAGETDKDFIFEFRLVGGTGVAYEDGYEYPCTPSTVNGSSNVIKIKNGDLITLKHGQSITIDELPAGVQYEVSEYDYSGDDYYTTATGNTGEIKTENLANPKLTSFTNLKTVGDLTILKTVAGNAGDTTKKFEFTVTFTGKATDYIFDYIGIGVPNGVIQSGDTISLTHDQSITIKGIPATTNYTVTEKSYASEGYVTTVTGANGTIATDVTSSASFTNTRNVFFPMPENGTLTISKTVAGTGADTTQKFNFKVTFTGANAAYPYTGNGIPNGTIKSGDTISLAHGQSITISKLPVGATYQVTEDSASSEGYTLNSTGTIGTISESRDSIAAFTNTKISAPTGSLIIRKTVSGQSADHAKKFEFTVTFTGAPDAYPYTGASTGTLRSGNSILLADGESITITGLPEGAKYIVTESDYSAEGYISNSTGTTGEIVKNAVQTATFTNTKKDAASETGKLTISKTVSGTGAETAKKFNFTITFTGATASYPYTGNGIPNGTIKSGDTISLAHGQSITISNIPVGVIYSVTEETAKGYFAESTGSTGTISSSNDSAAAFNNVKLAADTGNLTIKKTVTGDGADQAKKFKFTVTFTGAPDSYPYTGASSGTLRSGDSILLANGESITITGLPDGAVYKVTEADYSDEYTSDETGAAGRISANAVQTASFVNNKFISESTGGPGNPDPKDPDPKEQEPKEQEPKDPDPKEQEPNIPDPKDPKPEDPKVGMPKTGETDTSNFALVGLIIFFAAFAVLLIVDFTLRRKRLN